MNGTPCEEYRELASAFVDERLDGAELLRLDRHLGACAGCRGFERELRRARGLLVAAEAVLPLRRPPPGFAAAVMRRVAAEPLPEARLVPYPARRPAGVWAGLALAAAAAAVFFAWSWFRVLPADRDRMATRTSAPAPIQLAGEANGSMADLLQRHASIAREATILGPAAEVDFAAFRETAAPAR